MILRLRYGREHLHRRPARPALPGAASPPRRGPSRRLRELVETALDPPGSPARRSRELARGRRSCTVLVPDATRSASLPEVLPLVLDRLAAAGVAGRDDHRAGGVRHPPAGPRGRGARPGGPAAGRRDPRPARRQRPEHAAPRRRPADRPRRCGCTAPCSTPTWWSPISKVQHHYFAGFGGGPKLVFPGVAGYDEIQANHARVLDLAATPPRRHPGCEPGHLAGNPVAEEIAVAAALRPPDFAVLLVERRGGQARVVRGRPARRLLPGRLRQGPGDVRGGGRPLRPHRRRAPAAPPATTPSSRPTRPSTPPAASPRPAPRSSSLAACDGGAGSPAMEPFLADPRPERILALLAEHYVQYGQTTLRLVEKTARFRVTAISELPPELQTRLGMTPAQDLAAILDRWRDEAPGATVAVFPGPPVYPAHPPTQG